VEWTRHRVSKCGAIWDFPAGALAHDSVMTQSMEKLYERIFGRNDGDDSDGATLDREMTLELR
jgi:hypothetical protein